ncbi:hypothetical protein BX600DRAFT_462182 [Xylariales sp. PMI_506]|nr:hypothetical protein BX600DRAFT_462182 [Xylariales sp. PMI_506]
MCVFFFFISYFCFGLLSSNFCGHMPTSQVVTADRESFYSHVLSSYLLVTSQLYEFLSPRPFSRLRVAALHTWRYI